MPRGKYPREQTSLFYSKVKNKEVKQCPDCPEKYLPTKESPDKCLYCKRGVVFIRRVNNFI